MVQTNKHYLLLLLCTSWLITAMPALNAQEVWPGDVNNNGIVNKVDLLYWGVAKDASGEQREDFGTNWEPYDATEEWEEAFPNGLDFSYADADGKGNIKNSDRKAILEDNYGEIHGILEPEVFLEGDPNTDPGFLFVPQDGTTVSPDDEIKFDVVLGSAELPVDHYFGIAFTIYFDANYAAAHADNGKPWKPKDIDFKLENNTWLNDGGNDQSDEYLYLHEVEGGLDVIIVRKDEGESSGHGTIAEFSIVIEDIILMHDVNTFLWIDDIMLIDESLEQYAVAGTSTNFTILANGNQSLVSQQDDHTEETLQVRQSDTPEPPLVAEQGEAEQEETPETMVVFPNPASDWLTVKPENDEQIQEIQIFNIQGHLVWQTQEDETDQQRINIKQLTPGLYFLHLYTTTGKSVHLFSKIFD